MATEAKDLRALTRGGGADRAGGAPAKTTAVPMPPFAWGTRVWLPAGILLGVAMLFAGSATDMLRPATAVTVIPVVVKASTEPATAGAATVQAPGWVEAAPYSISVSALTDGVVREVLVLEGQFVKAGQVVARMIDDDAKLALARAEASLAEHEATLNAAQRQWDHPTERTRAVATAEGTVAETRAELTQLQAAVAAEEARTAELKDRTERSQRAFATSAATELEVVQTKLQLAAQEGTLAATKARRPVLEAQLHQREAELAAAKENLELRIAETKELATAKAAVDTARAMRDEAKLRLDRMEVRSPADGIVMERMIEPGSKLSFAMDPEHSAHAVRLYDPAKLQVRVDVPLADAAKVGVGQAAKIVIGVLPDRTFDGIVTRVVHQADLQKNTLQVKVAITAPSPELKPEMLARVRFVPHAEVNGATTQSSQSVFAPESLIRPEGVWVVDGKTSTATLRKVQPGESRFSGWVSIREGLFPGDQLIAGDITHLHEGARVRVTGEAPDVAMDSSQPNGGSRAAH
jgi:HlyD family secretion protein